MDDTKKMLKLIINGQSQMKAELLGEIKKIDKKVDSKFDRLDKKIDGVEVRLTKRIDKIGKAVAFLEDDTPTREEFDELKKALIN